MLKFVPYYRVSSKVQLKGNGFTRQEEIIKNYINSLNDSEIIKEFWEVKSGRIAKKQIELQKAIITAKENNAILIVSDLDRLSRDAEFLIGLQNRNINFFACDIPDANFATLGNFAAWSQYENEKRANLVKNGMTERRNLSGEWRIGTINNEARAKGQISIKENAANNINTIRAAEFAKLLRIENPDITLLEIATRLNNSGHLTPRNKQFHKASVLKLFLFNPPK